MEDSRDPAIAGSRPDPGVTAPLEWEFRPWRDAPGMAWGAVAGFAACAGALLLLPLPLLVKGAFALLLALALEPALVPSRFRVDEAGLARRTPLGESRLAWTSVRRWRRHSLGLEVSGSAPAWLPGEGRRLRLYIAAPERPRLLAGLEERCARHVG